MEWAQAATIVFAVAAFTGLQALWISRALDRVHAALDRLELKLDQLAGAALRDRAERIAPRSDARRLTERAPCAPPTR